MHFWIDKVCKTPPIVYESDSSKIIRKYQQCGRLSKVELGCNGKYTISMHFWIDKVCKTPPIVYESDSSKIIRKYQQCGRLSKVELGCNGKYTITINMNLRRLIHF